MFKHIPVIWDNSYKSLNYKKEQFKDLSQLNQWLDLGYDRESLTIDTYNYPDPMPSWTNDVLKNFSHLHNIGLSFHRLRPGHYLPEHLDLYSLYKSKFSVKLENIERIVLFLENGKSGQYNTVGSTVYNNWTAGSYICWKGSEKHSAVNISTENRYVLIITGHQ